MCAALRQFWPLEAVRRPGSASWLVLRQLSSAGPPRQPESESEPSEQALEPLEFGERSPGPRLLLLHPHDKSGAGRQDRQRQHLLVQEAAALVRALPGWSVVETLQQPVHSTATKSLLGPGQMAELKRKLADMRHVTGVLVNVERLTALQQVSLEAELRRPLLDRYGLVLRVIRQHASSRAAKLQVALAQLPYLRSRLRAAGGGGGAQLEGLRERERRLRAALQQVRQRRQLQRDASAALRPPVVGVVGYTNAGKTTLISALSSARRLRGSQHPFATLDVSAHRADHQHLRHLYLDTVGFMAQLPSALVEGFRTTLAEVAAADLLLHAVDLSHPDRQAQTEHVVSTLQQLGLPQPLLDARLTVGTKADLSSARPPHMLCVSAVSGAGLQQLRQLLEQRLQQLTGRGQVLVTAPTGGTTYAYVLKHCDLVAEWPMSGQPQLTCMQVVATDAQLARLRRTFPGVLVSPVTQQAPVR